MSKLVATKRGDELIREAIRVMRGYHIETRRYRFTVSFQEPVNGCLSYWATVKAVSKKSQLSFQFELYDGIKNYYVSYPTLGE